MTLMILDDQTNVVRGIMSGIAWKGLGFSNVIPAYHAVEARQVLERQPVDILLCDIEMPMENGISFLQWMRRQGIRTECIFLTAHAEFEYAREAVRLGSFDYILQPASYEKIRDVVLRAAERVRQQHEQARFTEFGRAVGHRNIMVMGSVLRDYLVGHNVANYHEFERLGRLPALSKPGYLVLIQIVRNESKETQHPSMLQYAFDNMLAELFTPYEQQVYLTCLSDTRYALIISGSGDYRIDQGGVGRQILSLHEVCKKHFHLGLACYVQDLSAIKDAPGAMQQLLGRYERNVSLTEGVFFTEDDPQVPAPTGHQKQVHLLQTLMEDQLYDAVKRSIAGYLDTLVRNGRLSKETLESFYHDIMSLYYTYGDLSALKKALGSPHGSDLLHNASRSIQQMKRLIDYITEALSNTTGEKQASEIERVIGYIRDNIEQDIKCSELADHVHMSSNYLTKVFKRETGVPLKEYIIQEKIKVAHSLLTTTALSVSIISSKVGYDNFSYFSRLYKKIMGKSPTEER